MRASGYSEHHRFFVFVFFFFVRTTIYLLLWSEGVKEGFAIQGAVNQQAGLQPQDHFYKNIEGEAKTVVISLYLSRTLLLDSDFLTTI
jgi:hypothetical protein